MRDCCWDRALSLHFPLQPRCTGGRFHSLEVKGTRLCVERACCLFSPILFLAQGIAARLLQIPLGSCRVKVVLLTGGPAGSSPSQHGAGGLPCCGWVAAIKSPSLSGVLLQFALNPASKFRSLAFHSFLGALESTIQVKLTRVRFSPVKWEEFLWHRMAVTHLGDTHP